MLIDAIFHVYKSAKEGKYQYADGRLLKDLNKKDKFIVTKEITIKEYKKKCNDKGYLEICDTSKYEVIEIDSIFSYGEYWEELSAGMSARLIALCNVLIEEDDMIYKIVHQN